ncbi:Metacaspase-1 [Termitomyces sp. T112]|nr:Metacaspase-1 [Termitomyces sp. T112]
MAITGNQSACRPEYSLETLVRPPLRRALLVGVEYTRDEEAAGDSANALNGPHNDVFAMRQLLMDCYEYLPEDIVVLVDTDNPLQTQPTRDNLICAMNNLVNGAQAGDRFFFHYAGHTTQVESEDLNEEGDGLDECIIPSDGESNLIRDNELRRYLVDPLPVGSNLVAVFDSCHSASLLDLQHIECNQVYVPWVSKGKRKSDSRLNDNVRRQTLVFPQSLYQNKLRHRERHNSAAPIPFTSCHCKTIDNRRTRSVTIKPELESRYGTFSSPIEQCDSPDSMWACNGWCHPEVPKHANVISLAACKDEQLSWEAADGSSMTAALVKILRSDPHPQIHHLLRDISHCLHDMYLRLHDSGRRIRKQVRELNKKRVARGLPSRDFPPEFKPEMDNFQDPQISSHHPISRDALWSP